MKNEEFVTKMREILTKAGEAADMSLDWQVVSEDPDCVADFGCDGAGNLVIQGDSFPLKISDVTGIRYRWNGETDASDCFFRFDFGKSAYLDCCFSDCEVGQMYHVKYRDTAKFCLKKDEAIRLLETLNGAQDA